MAAASISWSGRVPCDPGNAMRQKPWIKQPAYVRMLLAASYLLCAHDLANPAGHLAKAHEDPKTASSVGKIVKQYRVAPDRCSILPGLTASPQRKRYSNLQLYDAMAHNNGSSIEIRSATSPRMDNGPILLLRYVLHLDHKTDYTGVRQPCTAIDQRSTSIPNSRRSQTRLDDSGQVAVIL
jgi:hypothetical protein